MALVITKVSARSDGSMIPHNSETKFADVAIKGSASEPRQAVYIYDNDGTESVFKTTSNDDLSWSSWPDTLEPGEHKFNAKLSWDAEVSTEWVIKVVPS